MSLIGRAGWRTRLPGGACVEGEAGLIRSRIAYVAGLAADGDGLGRLVTAVAAALRRTDNGCRWRMRCGGLTTRPRWGPPAIGRVDRGSSRSATRFQTRRCGPVGSGFRPVKRIHPNERPGDERPSAGADRPESLLPLDFRRVMLESNRALAPASAVCLLPRAGPKIDALGVAVVAPPRIAVPPSERWPLRTRKKDYLVQVGRMDPVKGGDRAIEAARPAGRRLPMAGPVQAGPKQYFRERVEPQPAGCASSGRSAAASRSCSQMQPCC